MDRDAVKEPVYEAKDKQNRLVRIVEKVIAVVATIALWVFLVLTLYHKLFVDVTPSLIRVLWILARSLGGAVLIMGVWQSYNWFRFHKKARRKEFKRQSLADLGSLYGISAQNMERLQEIRSVAVVEFKNHRYYYCIAGEAPIEIGMLRKR
ncbi:hypothetical protein SAMN05216582_12110 [Selenomonas ruminantium]|uniref:Poly-beta-1,6-N-acetyl-D-glucosamine biosynthesis protein PgaD n=2 Tax=Selenomonas ruminantium TaxID=971 RepID=A0A1M6VWE6_SELRU|nr:hypothetical protein SAMN05216582_12110 [Selenomonas ruminantium]